ncbi:MAG: DUF1828 domain-containing protein [Methanomassiliicoccaceae archaeon]|nr:DUF1828 domain-containing protein [Methanomassiliicoccaceae archaeon]
MNRDQILEVIQKSVCSGVEIEEKGIDRYVVHTDFTYPDGDEIRIILKKQDGQWIFTDEGHTLMWLSYEDLYITAESKRSDLLARTLAYNHAEIVDGRICVKFKESEIRGAIHSMIQAIIQIADLIYTTRENIRGTFVEDMHASFTACLKEIGKERKSETNKIIKNKAGEPYNVDIYIEATEPILVFAVNSKDRCQEATIAIITLATEDQMKFTSLFVIDEEAEIPQITKDRAISRADKAFIGLLNMKAGLPRFLDKNICTDVKAGGVVVDDSC